MILVITGRCIKIISEKMYLNAFLELMGSFISFVFIAFDLIIIMKVKFSGNAGPQDMCMDNV
jgi:hypothetical protein